METFRKLRYVWYTVGIAVIASSVYRAWIQYRAGDLSHAITHVTVILWVLIALFESHQSDYWFTEYQEAVDRHLETLEQLNRLFR